MTDHLSDVQLSRLIDGDLSLISRESILTHLRACPGCAARHDELVSVAAALRLQPAATWTSTEMTRLVATLPQRRHTLRAALAVGASLLLGAAALIAAMPITVAAAHVVAGIGSVIGPAAPSGLTGSGARTLIAIAAIAILAPLASDPFARWR